MKTKIVKPCGYLFVGKDTFLLLSSEPVVRDSWQNDGTYRFVCVPTLPVDSNDKVEVYEYARHVVTNCFAIEYRLDLPPIKINVLESEDMDKIEENYE